MARKKFKCTKCDRSFSMAAHLGRHTNTMHGAGGARRRVLGRPPKVRPAATYGVGASHLLSGMRDYHDELVGKRDQIDRELSAIDDAMTALGSAPAPSRAPAGVRRPRGAKGHRDGSLKSFIVNVLGRQSSPATPKEIAAKVVKAGYKSRAQDLTKAVSNALPELKEIKKIGFGKYCMR
jgi:hypothetical protein